MRSALITGASSGIGEALAELLAKKGFLLYLSGRNVEKLDSLAKRVQAKKVVVADLSDPSERGKLVALIHEEKPDLLINNAGFAIYGDAFSIPVEEQKKILEVNGAAVLELTLEAVQAWKSAGKKGVVMNISSAAGDIPSPGMTVYGASKAFVTHFSRSLNTELEDRGIFILASCPGMVATDFANRASGKKVKQHGPVMTSAYAAEQILKQIEKRKEKRIFNWQYRLGSWIALHFLPLSWIKKIIWNRIKQRL